ncbi:Cyclic nucleotide-gated cation channel beta-1, partial [Ophiophagus hannah]
MQLGLFLIILAVHKSLQHFSGKDTPDSGSQVSATGLLGPKQGTRGYGCPIFAPRKLQGGLLGPKWSMGGEGKKERKKEKEGMENEEGMEQRKRGKEGREKERKKKERKKERKRGRGESKKERGREGGRNKKKEKRGREGRREGRKGEGKGKEGEKKERNEGPQTLAQDTASEDALKEHSNPGLEGTSELAAAAERERQLIPFDSSFYTELSNGSANQQLLWLLLKQWTGVKTCWSQHSFPLELCMCNCPGRRGDASLALIISVLQLEAMGKDLLLNWSLPLWAVSSLLPR